MTVSYRFKPQRDGLVARLLDVTDEAFSLKATFVVGPSRSKAVITLQRTLPDGCQDATQGLLTAEQAASFAAEAGAITDVTDYILSFDIGTDLKTQLLVLLFPANGRPFNRPTIVFGEPTWFDDHRHHGVSMSAQSVLAMFGLSQAER